ncbi:hypothetical protein [Sulfurimonas sp. CS5]|jgi:hypothetical protein|uniref:hypothetical protein n=1 Tax=Sulfurimonas sp. CS5 TaxID=3391145 RepID=UPI0039EC28B2
MPRLFRINFIGFYYIVNCVVSKSKNLITDGGYGVIVHLSGFNGNEMFIVPNQDGYNFDSFGVSDVADISYIELPSGDLQVSGFTTNNIFTRVAS